MGIEVEYEFCRGKTTVRPFAIYEHISFRKRTLVSGHRFYPATAVRHVEKTSNWPRKIHQIIHKNDMKMP